MRINPFKPNDIVAPGMFQGRYSEIESIENYLLQAKGENPIHFLIEGERGIGKSSLLFFIQHIASGSIERLDKVPMNFMVLLVDLGSCKSQLDIVRALARELKGALSQRTALKTAAKDVWDWLTNWEVLGVRYHKDRDDYDSQDALEELIEKVAELCLQPKPSFDGILILIDEASAPGDEGDLGTLCKMFVERLTRRGCNKVALGLAGLPDLTPQLRKSHESSLRLFQVMKLRTLSKEDVHTVIKRAIEKANETNPEKTEIAKSAAEFLVELSEGYPHFIQQFGFSAFECDTDGKITKEDVVVGAFRDNGALYQLGEKYFNDMYYTKIQSDAYRKVLDTMSKHGDKWVSKQQIKKDSKLAESTITNALAALKSRNIILVDDKRRGQGYYRLPTQSFATWIGASKAVQEQAKKSKSLL